MRKVFLVVSMMAAFIIAGCAPKVMVPPRVDLKGYEIIGLVEFESNSEGNFGHYVTQRFMEAITEDQPGIKIVELGTKDELLAELGMSSLGPEALDSIARRFGIKTLITGNLDLSQPSPNLHGILGVTSMGMNLDVSAMLTVKLRDTNSGATVWTASASDEREIANVGFGGGLFNLDAEDPDKAYGKLTDKLLEKVTRDFRVTYERKRD